MRHTSILTLSFLAALLSTAAFATTYTFTPGTFSGSSTDTLTSTTGGASLTLNGYDVLSTEGVSSNSGNWNPANVLADNITSTSGSLGLVDEYFTGTNTQHVDSPTGITPTSFIQFDPFKTFTSITSIVITVSPDAGFSSSQYDIWQGISAADPGAWVVTGNTSTSDTITLSSVSSATPYLSLSGGVDCDFNITSIVITGSLTTQTSTPEPSTFALSLLAGLVLISPAVMKRFAKK